MIWVRLLAFCAVGIPAPLHSQWPHRGASSGGLAIDPRFRRRVVWIGLVAAVAGWPERCRRWMACPPSRWRVQLGCSPRPPDGQSADCSTSYLADLHGSLAVLGDLVADGQGAADLRMAFPGLGWGPRVKRGEDQNDPAVRIPAAASLAAGLDWIFTSGSGGLVAVLAIAGVGDDLSRGLSQAPISWESELKSGSLVGLRA